MLELLKKCLVTKQKQETEKQQRYPAEISYLLSFFFNNTYHSGCPDPFNV